MKALSKKEKLLGDIISLVLVIIAIVIIIKNIFF